jgi:type II secretion system protein C
MSRSWLGKWKSIGSAALLFGLACAQMQITFRLARELRGTRSELGWVTAPASVLALSGSSTLAAGQTTLTTPSPWVSAGSSPQPTNEPASRPNVEAPRNSTLSGLLRGVRVVPEQRDGKLVGLRLRGVRPDGLLGHIGLKEGDRLDTINGYRVTEPNEVLVLYTRLRQLDHLSIAIERDGRPLTIEINVV